jgi:hypothetical protein
MRRWLADAGLFPSLLAASFPCSMSSLRSRAKNILPTRSSHPLLLDGFCTIGRDGLRRWGVANLTATARVIRV